MHVQMAVLSLQVEEMTSDHLARKQHGPGQQLQQPRRQTEPVQRSDCHPDQAVGLVDPDKSKCCHLHPGPLPGNMQSCLALQLLNQKVDIELQYATI